jgi:hypothetical protein
MTGLLGAEWLKVTSTRMVWGLAIGAAAFTALNVVALIFVSGQPGAPPLTEPGALRNVFASIGSASVIILVFGILQMTTEYRHLTVSSTFLATPRRGRMLAAKMAVSAVFGLLGGIVVCIVGVGLALALLPLREHAPVDASTVTQIVGGVLLAFTIYAVLGVALGALIRNQVVAILAALVWVLLAESLTVALLPDVGKWLPGGAATSVLQGTSFDGSDAYLPPWAGALLLLAYGVVFAVVAARTTLRRDVT